MKKFSIYLLPALMVLTFTACKKDQYYLYKDAAMIQFGPAPDRIYSASFDMADTLKPYTFYYETPDVVQDTVFFDVYAVGGVSKTDRPFVLEQEQVPDLLNAVPGTHYKALNDPSLKAAYTIKAGEVHASVPVILLRDPSLKTGTYHLTIKVAANEHFKKGEVRKLWRKVEFTDRLSRPAAWNASGVQYYWGKYSTVKHAFMIEKSGEKWDQEFMTTVFTDFAMVSYWRAQLKTYLVDYNKAHPNNPLTDEDGELVAFP